jgi:hypothetical protein
MESTKVWPAALVTIVALIICTILTISYMPTVPDKLTAIVDNSAVIAGLNEIKTGIDALKATQPAQIVTPVVPSSDKIDKIYDEVLRDKLKETKAEELINIEIDSRSFKKLVFEALENENETIENFKDITKFVVTDTDTSIDGDTATATFTLKAYYFVDGDEEETQKAKISVVFEVSDLDETNNYMDAEVVDDYEIEVLNIYD